MANGCTSRVVSRTQPPRVVSRTQPSRVVCRTRRRSPRGSWRVSTRHQPRGTMRHHARSVKDYETCSYFGPVCATPKTYLTPS
eukprot:scaffold10209_cov68-Phaeocystis_antarctica.AAC.6